MFATNLITNPVILLRNFILCLGPKMRTCESRNLIEILGNTKNLSDTDQVF